MTEADGPPKVSKKVKMMAFSISEARSPPKVSWKALMKESMKVALTSTVSEGSKEGIAEGLSLIHI